MEMLRVHFNNRRCTSGRQWFKKPNKDAFVFIVAFQCISKSAANQFQEKAFPEI